MSLTAPVQPVSALILVDVQRGFLTGAHALPQTKQLLVTLSALLNRARRASALIVHLQNDGGYGEVDEPHTPGWQLHFESTPSQTEYIIRKTSDDGFIGTPLEAVLKRHEVKSLVLGGLLSEMCVSATARTALAKGYRVVLPSDAHGTYDLQEISASVVARVAEHALGDVVTLVSRSANVKFGRR